MAKKRDEDKLILLLPEEVASQLDRIFERLAEDEELRARFTDDPAGAMKELGIDVPAGTDIGLLNRVVFHLMGDEKFIAWSQEYNKKLRERYGDVVALDKEISEAIGKDINAAMLEHLPPKLKAEYRQGFPAAGSMIGPIIGPITGPSGPITGPSGPITTPSGPIPTPSGPITTPSGPIPGPSYQFHSEFEFEVNIIFIFNAMVFYNVSYQYNVSGVGGGKGGPGADG